MVVEVDNARRTSILFDRVGQYAHAFVRMRH